MTDTVLYVAGSEQRAADGAAALGRVVDDTIVEPVTGVEAVRSRAGGANCVVFAETPTTQAGTNLREVVGATGDTPLVLFSESVYGPTTARSTDGIAGYVRSDTPNAHAHLADEIAWVGAGDDASGLERIRSWPGRLATAETTEAVYEAIAELGNSVATVAETALYRIEDGQVVAWDSLEDPSSEPVVRGLASEAIDRGHPQRSDDVLERPELAGERVAYRSVLCVPLGQVGAIAVLAEEPGAFDEGTLEEVVLLTRMGALRLGAVTAAARAETAERHLEELFEKLPVAAVRLEHAGDEATIEAVNPTFADLFGYEEANVVGRSLEETLVPVGFDVDASNVQEAFQAGGATSTTTRRQTAEGVREVEVTVVPAGSDRGYALYQDVTGPERRGRMIAAQRDRLAEIGRLVDGLRDPLNLANAYTEAAQRTGDQDHFEEVTDALEWMDDTINSLVVLTRQLEVITETEPVALHDIARRAWTAVDDHRASLELEDDTIIEADKVRLTECFEILFGNAIEHATVDGTVTVRVGTTDDGFYIEDDGPGIPEHRRSSVFDPGYTTSRDGTGYGLDLLERIVQAHGWRVSIETGSDGGARFAFSGVAAPDVSLS